MHIPIVVPFYSESLCFIPYAPILCVLSVCGESFIPSGTCNLLLSGREPSHVAWRVHWFAGPPPDPLRGPPILPAAYGSRLGFPRLQIPLEVTVPTHVHPSPSFFWRVCLSFECQSRKKSNVRSDSRNMKKIDSSSISGYKLAWRPHEFP